MYHTDTVRTHTYVRTWCGAAYTTHTHFLQRCVHIHSLTCCTCASTNVPSEQLALLWVWVGVFVCCHGCVLGMGWVWVLPLASCQVSCGGLGLL